MSSLIFYSCYCRFFLSLMRILALLIYSATALKTFSLLNFCCASSIYLASSSFCSSVRYYSASSLTAIILDRASAFLSLSFFAIIVELLISSVFLDFLKIVRIDWSIFYFICCSAEVRGLPALFDGFFKTFYSCERSIMF